MGWVHGTPPPDTADGDAAEEDLALAIARLMVRAGARLRVGDAAGAADLYRQVLALDPGQAAALLHRANAFMRLQQPQAALAATEEALVLLPHDHALHYTRALALHQAQRLGEALGAFEQALALGAPPQQVRFAQAATHLMRGDYQAGWPVYEMREAREKALAPWLARGLTEPPLGVFAAAADPGSRVIGPSQAMPQPTAVAGASPGLLLVAEQGYGDMIQFSRFAIDLAARGVPVWLACPPPLRTLLSRLPGIRGVLEAAAPAAGPGSAGWPPVLRWVLPLASLPLHLGLRSPAAVPHAGGYLQADPARVALWAERLGPGSGARSSPPSGARTGPPTSAHPRPRIGLAWSGGEHRAADWGRSIPLAQLLPWLPEGIDYIHLQPAIRDADRPALASAPHIRHFGDAIRDFEDTAALCTLVDEVVTVCTSAAHLAGALGRPTRVLLRATPCWRWQLARDDSDWYRSVRLMRQDPPDGQGTPRGWQRVLKPLSAALSALASSR